MLNLTLKVGIKMGKPYRLPDKCPLHLDGLSRLNFRKQILYCSNIGLRVLTGKSSMCSKTFILWFEDAALNGFQFFSVPFSFHVSSSHKLWLAEIRKNCFFVAVLFAQFFQFHTTFHFASEPCQNYLGLCRN